MRVQRQIRSFLIKASQTTSYFMLPQSSAGGQIRSAIVLSGYCSHFFPVWIYEIIVFSGWKCNELRALNRVKAVFSFYHHLLCVNKFARCPYSTFKDPPLTSAISKGQRSKIISDRDGGLFHFHWHLSLLSQIMWRWHVTLGNMTGKSASGTRQPSSLLNSETLTWKTCYWHQRLRGKLLQQQHFFSLIKMKKR